MGLLQRLTHWRRPSRRQTRKPALKIFHGCQLEHLEERCVLAGDIKLGAIYLEPASGNDSVGNVFTVTWQGGAAGTELKRIYIDTDKLGDGLTLGDTLFDPALGGPGAQDDLGNDYGASPWDTVPSVAPNGAGIRILANGIQVTHVAVVDGGTTLAIDLNGFTAGKQLIFKIDVDEQGFLSPNAVAEGNEFEGSKLTATFQTTDGAQMQGTSIFLDSFNTALTQSGLTLPNDKYDGGFVPPGAQPSEDLRVLTAGAFVSLSTLSGNVYEDLNADNVHQAGEPGISNVSLALWRLNTTTGNYVNTGRTTTTDALGKYFFDIEPGTYRVVETQPSGYFSVGAAPGTVNGVSTGSVETVDILRGLAVPQNKDSINNDFEEALPASIKGRVHADRNGDCVYQEGEPLLDGVTIRLLDKDGNTLTTTKTNALGEYEFTNLPPGVYGVFEEQPIGYFQGGNELGTAGGKIVDFDTMINVKLVSRTAGVKYNFCEIEPASISGRVSVDPNQNKVFDAGELPLKDVKIELLNSLGVVIDTKLTDVDGNYKFMGLEPGHYTVRETQPAGYYDGGDVVGSAGGNNSVIDVISNANLTPALNAVHYDFFELPPTTISGYVFVDRNENCKFDEGEQIIPGVTIQLRDAAGQITTTQTGSNGKYSFTNLAPGVYSVIETQPAGYFDGCEEIGSEGGDNSVNDQIRTIRPKPGIDAVNYNFGELLPASIAGRVHADRNGDCIHQPSEPLLAGVTIQLLDHTGTVIQSTTTDVHGEYKFSNLAPGTYSVREIQPAGYFDGGEVLGSVGGDDSVPNLLANAPLGSGVQATEYNFCEIEPASIAGRVHADRNGDCMYQTGEPLLSGVTIQLLDHNGTVIQTTTTDAQGKYKFNNLAPGSYSVREIQPVGYFDGGESVGSAGGDDSVPNLLAHAVLGPAVNATEYNFCEIEPASIAGRVHADRNGDCMYQQGEPLLEGVTIQLLDSHGVVVETTQTDVNGKYKFTNLLPGVYSVREIQPTGYYDGGEAVGTAGGDDSFPNLLAHVPLGPAVNATEYNFCEQEPASIAGMVHADRNGDCLYQQGEPLLAGVTIQLLDSQGVVVVTTQTDVNGKYKFANLIPGTYSVREVQPTGYYDGGEAVGTAGGDASFPNLLAHVPLGPAVNATDYNFCEEEPASISGMVHVDRNGDCLYQTGEPLLEGVTIQLLDSQGHVLQTTETDAKGEYKFSNLAPGTYSVREVQPTGFYDGGQAVGTAGGDASFPNLLAHVPLGPAVHATDYNFCEFGPGSIRGQVHLDTTGNCLTATNLPGIAGVTIQLLDRDGNVLATTQTDANGDYVFDHLAPGTYGVRELQPTGYFDDDEHVGTAGGVLDDDLITQIALAAGVHATHYDFCETLGKISGYVFQDGSAIAVANPDQDLPDVVANIPKLRDGKRTPDDTPLAGVILHLADAEGNAILDASGKPIQTVTDANGFYQFTGLVPGTYSVFETQPAGYLDGVDTPGTTGGTSSYPGDAIFQISLVSSGVSQENNFSEVTITTTVIFIPPPPSPLPPPFVGAPLDAPKLILPPAPLIPGPPPPPVDLYSGNHVLGWTWHLSVVDAGQPRGNRTEEGRVARLTSNSTLVTASDTLPWGDANLKQSKWHRKPRGSAAATQIVFGMRGGIPVTGDFNGDGITDHGVYLNGHWFIDLNGNGEWDENDLRAKLGYDGDLPVTGDWDGDGKTDIGIFGRAWPRDTHAIKLEPGLPDQENVDALAREKNVPPDVEKAVLGWRTMRLTSQGKVRADLIDHVFHYGTANDHPVTGDFNGDGIHTIGVFRGGQWSLDQDGNGKYDDANDIKADFGAPGDLPVVGDFNGDGIDEIGVYRAGHWIVDSNGNRQLDSEDLQFDHGGASDRPVVGDWDGDGLDDPGLYQDGAANP